MKQLNTLTGLRGVAAYSVLIAHAFNTSFLFSGVNPLGEFTERIALFGIALFFVLSGFVIHYNYAKLIQSKGYISGGYQFISARIARLFPLYAMMMVFSLDCIPSNYFGDNIWAMLAYSTMTQSWFNLQNVFYPPAWSISTEWFFYFAFLFMLPIFSKIKRPLLVMGIFLIGAFCIIPGYIQLQLKLTGNSLGWSIYFSPYTRIFDFIGGVLASIAFISLKDNKPILKLWHIVASIACIAWCIAIIAVNPLKHNHFWILLSNFVFTPALAPLLLLLCHYDTFVSRILCSRPLIFMGEISYSVYLLGFLIMTALGAVYVNPTPTPLAYATSSFKVIIVLTLTTFIAYGCHNLFEKPMRNWIRKLLMPSKEKNEIGIMPETLAYDLKK